MNLINTCVQFGEEQVAQAIYSLACVSACGPTGLRTQHLNISDGRSILSTCSAEASGKRREPRTTSKKMYRLLIGNGGQTHCGLDNVFLFLFIFNRSIQYSWWL